MLKRIISVFLMLVLVASSSLGLAGCDFSTLFGGGGGGEGWLAFGETHKISVSHLSPRLSLTDRNSTLSHFSSCEVQINQSYGGSYKEDEGHYVYKNAAIIKTLTIDGSDYKIRIPVSDDGSAGGFTSSIRLNGSVEKSKILSGYIRDSGYEGYYKIEPHTLVDGKTYAPTCEDEGYTVIKCTGCRYTDKKDIVPALGHSHGTDGVCTACGNVAETTTEETAGTPETPDTPSVGQIGCVHDAYIRASVPDSGLGVVTGTLTIKLDKPETISSYDAMSTKTDIIVITDVSFVGENIILTYKIMGHGEADVLVQLEAESINADRLCEIHVIISDED